MTRMRTIMEAAAEELTSGGDPFTQEFIDRFDMTVLEMDSLADSMAAGLGMIIMFADMEDEEGVDVFGEPVVQPLIYVD